MLLNFQCPRAEIEADRSLLRVLGCVPSTSCSDRQKRVSPALAFKTHGARFYCFYFGKGQNKGQFIIKSSARLSLKIRKGDVFKEASCCLTQAIHLNMFGLSQSNGCPGKPLREMIDFHSRAGSVHLIFLFIELLHLLFQFFLATFPIGFCRIKDITNTQTTSEILSVFSNHRSLRELPASPGRTKNFYPGDLRTGFQVLGS